MMEGAAIAKSYTLPGGRLFVLPTLFSFSQGVHFMNWSVGGSSIDRLIDGVLVRRDHFDDVFPLYEGVQGNFPQRIAWIDIGTNSQVEEVRPVAIYKEQLKQFISNLRDKWPNLPLIMITAFADNYVPDGTIRAYVDANLEVAAEVGNALALDTFREMPSYAQGNASGFYTDVTHYGSLGVAVYAHRISRLIRNKAGKSLYNPSIEFSGLLGAWYVDEGGYIFINRDSYFMGSIFWERFIYDSCSNRA
jgi:hypothetical protein